jgi:hypothetical protein
VLAHLVELAEEGLVQGDGKNGWRRSR